MKWTDGENTYYTHPTLRVVVTEDDKVFRIARACLVPVSIVMTGKNGRPYPAANVQEAYGRWTFKTLGRTLHEARTGRALPREIHAHHGEGRAKSDFRFGSVSPLDQVTHGRESALKRIAMRKEATT